jgi:hypothetical protein
MNNFIAFMICFQIFGFSAKYGIYRYFTISWYYLLALGFSCDTCQVDYVQNLLISKYWLGFMITQ